MYEESFSRSLSLQTNLEAITEDVIEALNDKNPNVKGETAAFLGRAFSKATPATLTKKNLKPIVPVLVQVSGSCLYTRDQWTS